MSQYDPSQLPPFYDRELHPTVYKAPTSCMLANAIRNENHLIIDAARSTRNPKGGVEATLGTFTTTPFHPTVNPLIVQPPNNRFDAIHTRMTRHAN